ncbi:MAG: hypothetical protein IKD91_09350, partial [Clostridiales bacterium]|nr:hypothetical protein [Clostridiales bacterium]
PTPTPVTGLGPGPGWNLDIEISKQDIAGDEIPEAKLTLTSLDGYDLSGVIVTQNGEPVEITISDDKTSVSFDTVDTYKSIIRGLRAGRYELKETVTPEAYLTAEAITFSLMNNGDADREDLTELVVAGSPIIMVDEADPTYEQGGGTSVISADRNPKSIPATGEENNFSVVTGLIVTILASVCLTGSGVFRIKKKND